MDAKLGHEWIDLLAQNVVAARCPPHEPQATWMLGLDVDAPFLVRRAPLRCGGIVLLGQESQLLTTKWGLVGADERDGDLHIEWQHDLDVIHDLVRRKTAAAPLERLAPRPRRGRPHIESGGLRRDATDEEPPVLITLAEQRIVGPRQDVGLFVVAVPQSGSGTELASGDRT